jgi:exosortase
VDRAIPGDLSASDVLPRTSESNLLRQLRVALALVVLAFAPTILRTAGIWWENPEYSHGLLMPLVAAWMAWSRRDRLRAMHSGTSLWAVPALLLGLAIRITAELQVAASLAPFAFVGSLGAVVLAFAGWRGLRVCFPVLVPLLLACPLPVQAEEALTLPLKGLSAEIAAGLLHLFGIPTFLDGNTLHLEGASSLWVADACSGMRSLLSLLSLAILSFLVWERHWSLKALVGVAAVAIAIVVNGLRIWTIAMLSVKVSPAAAEGAFHLLEGFVLFAVAGLLLLGFVWILGVLFPRRAG